MSAGQTTESVVWYGVPTAVGMHKSGVLRIRSGVLRIIKMMDEQLQGPEIFNCISKNIPY